MSAACSGGHRENARPTVVQATKDTTVYLQPDHSGPTCRLKLDIAYLKPASATDSLSEAINRAICRQVFGPASGETDVQTLTGRLADEYISDYHTDVKHLFEADLRNGMKPSEAPAWYNYEYSLTTSLTAGYNGVWNYTVTDYRYTGGAHPNTVVRYLNFLPHSGRQLTADDVFSARDTAAVCRLILRALIRETNRKLDTDTISSLQGLQENGVLLDTPLYIPANFLLGKDGVTFYYNRYEIAPYSCGEFVLHIPYADIKNYIRPTITEQPANASHSTSAGKAHTA